MGDVGGVAERLRPYRVLVRSRVRAQTAYRASFALDVLGNVGIGAIEFVEIYTILTRVDGLGGLDASGALLVFALANVAFSLADLAVGHVDERPRYLRAGTLDAFLLRPLPVLAQAHDRGRVAEAARTHRPGPRGARRRRAHRRLRLDAGTRGPARADPAGGCGALRGAVRRGERLPVLAGRRQRATNSFTYGGSYAASYPASVYGVVLRTVFAFVVPAAFVAYLPALLLTGSPGPAGLPSWLGWCTPVVALLAWAVAGLTWRAGLRHHTGAGG
ncbi:ABC transporter permease [Angustibacter aerolatus]|uniref:ABC transporter permease n=1 Tax=Angustibacter aerolatus TaxID=1162965 RepID=A0ABQ6JLP0_9ACTN|nr:ABC-2 family transporter protein [Angustibacter aerolatus]GMA87767.1 ABC transporter permease [Angustibacter aerolatus]